MSARRARRVSTVGVVRNTINLAATVIYRDAAKPLTTVELSLGWMRDHGPYREVTA
jgi:hypothetical protein